MTRPRKLLAAVSTAHALDHAYLLALPPLLAPILAEFRGGLFGGGAALTWLYLASGLVAIPAGRLADRAGAGRTIALFLGGGAACLAATGFATDLRTLSLLLIPLGLCCGLYHPAGLSLISRRCVPVGRAMGIHGIGGSLGLSVGPFAAAQLAAWFGWRPALWILAGAGLLLLPFFLTIGPEPAGGGREEEGEDPVPDRTAFTLAVGCQALAGFAYRGILTFLPLFFAARPGRLPGRLDPVIAGGLLTTISLAVGMAGQYVGGRISHRWPPERLYAVLLLATLPFPFLIAVGRGTGLLVAAAGFAFFFFAAQPVGNYLIARHSAAARRSSAFGISFTASFGFGSLAALAGGWVADSWSLAAVFPAMGVAVAGSIVVAAGLWNSAPMQRPLPPQLPPT